MAARGRTRSELLAFDFADVRARVREDAGVAKGVAKGSNDWGLETSPFRKTMFRRLLNTQVEWTLLALRHGRSQKGLSKAKSQRASPL